MAEVLHIRAGVALPLSEIELRTSRSSGPGGQHANVTASRVEAKKRRGDIKRARRRPDLD